VQASAAADAGFDVDRLIAAGTASVEDAAQRVTRALRGSVNGVAP